MKDKTQELRDGSHVSFVVKGITHTFDDMQACSAYMSHPEFQAHVLDNINEIGSAWPDAWGFWYRLEAIAWIPTECGIRVTGRIFSKENMESRLFQKAVEVEKQQMRYTSPVLWNVIGWNVLLPPSTRKAIEKKMERKAIKTVRKVRKALSTYEALSEHVKHAIPVMSRAGDQPIIFEMPLWSGRQIYFSHDDVSAVTPLRNLDEENRRLVLVKILEDRWTAILSSPYDPRGRAFLLKQFEELPEIYTMER